MRNTHRKLTLPSVRAAVIGLGAIGHQTAVQLVGLGVRRLMLIDANVVGRRQQVTEGYHADDVGRPKVHAAAEACHAVRPGCEIETCGQRRIRRGLAVDAVFCCAPVARWQRIWQSAIRWRAHFFAAGDVHEDRVFVATIADPQAAVSSGVEPDLRPPWGAGVRERVVAAPAAAIAAGLLVAEFGRFARGAGLSREVHFNLATYTLAVTGT